MMKLSNLIRQWFFLRSRAMMAVSNLIRHKSNRAQQCWRAMRILGQEGTKLVLQLE